jgi:hypothetical protein
MVVNGEALLLIIFTFDMFLCGVWKSSTMMLEEEYEGISKKAGKGGDRERAVCLLVV